MLLINPTREQLNEQAIKEDKILRLLEEEMARDLKRFFRRVLIDLEKGFERLGLIPDQDRYKDILEKLIFEHQEQTANIFSGTLRDDEIKSVKFFERKSHGTKVETEEEDSNVEEIVSAAMLLWIAEQSVEQANFILDTNTRQINRALESAKQDLIQGNEIFGNKEIIALALIKLDNRFDNRINLITDQVLGSAAEQSKLEEARALSNGSFTIGKEKVSGSLLKTWNGILDDRIRPWHAQADFTYNNNPIPIEEAFIVNGESLMEPKDPAGSPNNVNNCRCKMIVIFVTTS